MKKRKRRRREEDEVSVVPSEARDKNVGPNLNGEAAANTYQVGGNHYRSVPGEQHWDRMWRLHGPGYFIGNITGYAERYQDKNGVEDLKKCRHYVTKLIELEEAAANGTGPQPGGHTPPRSRKERTVKGE